MYDLLMILSSDSEVVVPSPTPYLPLPDMNEVPSPPNVLKPTVAEIVTEKIEDKTERK